MIGIEVFTDDELNCIRPCEFTECVWAETTEVRSEYNIPHFVQKCENCDRKILGSVLSKSLAGFLSSTDIRQYFPPKSEDEIMAERTSQLSISNQPY